MVEINQRVAILVDGNNIGMGVNQKFGYKYMLDYLTVIPKLVGKRTLTKLHYFREGLNISEKLEAVLRKHFYGTVHPCGKTADISITIQAVQMIDKVDTIVVMSGDSDFIPLYNFLKMRGIRVEIACCVGTVRTDVLDTVDSYYWIKQEDVRLPQQIKEAI
jgi:uncharacterized LabA/DUF88 family protein